MTDEKLARQAVRGDSAALELLVQRYHVPIYKYIYRLTADKTLTEELTQEAFCRLVRSLRRGDLPRSFRPYIYRTATNLCRDYWKSADYRRTALSEDPEALKGEETAGSPVVDLLLYQEERVAVVQAVSDLSQELREIIVLRFFEEMKINDIAAALELPTGTVKSRLYRAYRILKEELLAGEKGGAVSEQKKRS